MTHTSKTVDQNLGSYLLHEHKQEILKILIASENNLEKVSRVIYTILTHNSG